MKLCGEGFTVLKHRIIEKIELTTSRNLTYCELFLERISRDKQGATVFCQVFEKKHFVDAL